MYNLENNMGESNKAEHIHILWPINSMQGTYSTEMCTYLAQKTHTKMFIVVVLFVTISNWKLSKYPMKQ